MLFDERFVPQTYVSRFLSQWPIFPSLRSNNFRTKPDKVHRPRPPLLNSSKRLLYRILFLPHGVEITFWACRWTVEGRDRLVDVLQNEDEEGIEGFAAVAMVGGGRLNVLGGGGCRCFVFFLLGASDVIFDTGMQLSVLKHS